MKQLQSLLDKGKETDLNMVETKGVLQNQIQVLQSSLESKVDHDHGCFRKLQADYDQLNEKLEAMEQRLAAENEESEEDSAEGEDDGSIKKAVIDDNGDGSKAEGRTQQDQNRNITTENDGEEDTEGKRREMERAGS